MPPVKPKHKTVKLKKEDADRSKRILLAKEKVLGIKRMLLSIVETMSENSVSKEWLLANCSKLCHADYNDVIQERSIMHLCGYPLCSNIIKQMLKQQYQISLMRKKVYDLTERKCFCSNECYKASNYLRAQLSPIPLYMRKEEKIRIKLLSDCDNRGSAGEEIIFHHTISKEEVDNVYDEENDNSLNLQNMLNEEVKKCADSLSGLQIKEHVFDKQYVFEEGTPKKSDNSLSDGKNNSDSEQELDSDDSLDEKLFPDYDNVTVLSHRHMPIPEKMKKSVLIPPIKREVNTNPPVQELSLDFIPNVFKDWMTENTLKFLMGEKHVYGVKADHLFKTMTSDVSPNSERLASIKNEYIELCLKIDSLPDDDDVCDTAGLDFLCESKQKSDSPKIEKEKSTEKKVFKRRPRRSKEKEKKVTFAPETVKVEKPLQTEVDDNCKSDEKAASSNNESGKVSSEDGVDKTVNDVEKTKKQEKNSQPVEEKFSATSNYDIEADKEAPQEPVIAIPLVDSVAQNSLRRNVLMSKLKSVYNELLPVADLHYTEIRGAVRKFVDTLSLTPSNIIYKPKEWKIIALVLFRMLTRTVLKDINDELKFAKLCEDPVLPVPIDLREIESLICNLVSEENIINIH